jgi:transcriptional regulator with XRE-family HTH domain
MPAVPPERLAFAARLRTLRKQARMTQAAVASAAGMDRSFYVEVEHGRHSVSIDKVHRIADVLGVPVHLLFTEPLIGDGPDEGPGA